MKKYLAIVLCVILIFVITACDKSVNDTESNISVESQDTNNDTANTEKDKSNSSNKKISKNNNKNNSSKVGEDYEEYDNYEDLDDEYEYDSIPNYTNQSSNKPSSNDTENTDSLKQLDNGVLKDVSGKKMSVPENMKLLGTDDAKESNNAKNIKATAVLYQLDGNVVSWVTENDLIYVITSGNNRLVVINSKTMMAVASMSCRMMP